MSSKRPLDISELKLLLLNGQLLLQYLLQIQKVQLIICVSSAYTMQYMRYMYITGIIHACECTYNTGACTYTFV